MSPVELHFAIKKQSIFLGLTKGVADTFSYVMSSTLFLTTK